MSPDGPSARDWLIGRRGGGRGAVGRVRPAPARDAGPKREPTVAPEDLAEKLGKGPDGGPGVAHTTPALQPVADPPYPVPSGIQRSTGRSTFEPSIGVTSDGSVYYLAIDESKEIPGATILRSSEEGATWKVLPRGDPNGSTPTEDPLIYVDPLTDRPFDFELTLPCSVIYFRTTSARRSATASRATTPTTRRHWLWELVTAHDGVDAGEEKPRHGRYGRRGA